MSEMKTLDCYEKALAALCIWREARGESIEAKRGVMHVLLNRKNDPKGRWPRLISEVILQRLQFSSFNANDPNAALFPHWDNPAFRDCCAVVDDPGADPTGSANHYHSIPPGQPLPKWAEGQVQAAQLGAFRFYHL